jgi:hypothetical protein
MRHECRQGAAYRSLSLGSHVNETYAQASMRMAHWNGHFRRKAGKLLSRLKLSSHRVRDNRRLLERIRKLHDGSDGVMGSLRIWQELRYRGEPCGRNRVARLMRQQGLHGISQRKRWRKKVWDQRPGNVHNHLQRDFTASEPNVRWVTNIPHITYVRTQESWLYLCVVVDRTAPNPAVFYWRSW